MTKNDAYIRIFVGHYHANGNIIEFIKKITIWTRKYF